MKKILIIEDESILAEMYKEKFSQEGFEVLWAPDEKTGLELAEKKEPHIILLDILLGGEEDGVSFLKKLRKKPKISQIPVLAFSNYDEPRKRKECFQLGAKEYLLKTNYTPNELVKIVQKYI